MAYVKSITSEPAPYLDLMKSGDNLSDSQNEFC